MHDTFPQPTPIAHVSLSIGARSETFVDQTLGILDRKGWRSYVYGIEEHGHFSEVAPGRTRILPDLSMLERIGDRLRSRDPTERFASGMLDAARADGVGLVHAHFGWSGVYAAPLARQLGVPLVVTFYGSDAIETESAGRGGRSAAAPYERLFAAADAVIAVSQFVETALHEGGYTGEVLVIRNGIDLERLQPRDEVPATHGPLLVGFVGRLVHWKGADVLLESAAELVRTGLDVLVEIVGDGPEREPLQRLAADLGIADRVTLRGALTHDATLDVMRSCHVIAVPTRIGRSGATDSSSMVFKEALALGVPVVATAAGGLPETCPPAFRDELASPGSHKELAAALERVLSRPYEWPARASQGRTWIAERFALTRLADELTACYERLLRLRDGPH